jgi:hypothetical protein
MKMEECMAKRSLTTLILCALIGFPLNAAAVSFMVIETGLPPGGEGNRYSILWEDGLLEVFFDEGHIVFNAPMTHLDRKPAAAFPVEAQDALNEALQGGAEYFILALMDYSDSTNQETLRPRNVSLRLFRTRPYKMLYEQQYADGNSRTEKEEYISLKKAVLGLVSHLNDR